MQRPSAHLAIDSLRAGYRGNVILDGIDLSVEKGQFVALLGASGCGKTTLLRAIAGFETPISGHIQVAGRDVTDLPPDRRGMSMVFQSYALWPHKTVAEHIAYGPKLRHMPKDEIAARVARIEAMLGLEGLGERRPGALSGGQRQRVALGRALAVEPDILLLDEPLSNLDARIRLQLRGDIRELQQRLGITAIHVTHDREEAMVMADRIVILNAGHVMQDGAPEDVYNHPQSGFVAAFMGAENCVALEVRAGEDGPAIEASPMNRALDVSDRRLAPGPVEARFRATGLRLFPSSEHRAPVPGTLVLSGVVAGCTYPGGNWLNRVRIGETHIDVAAPHAFPTGAPVDVHVPRESLFLFGASAAPRTSKIPAPAFGAAGTPV